MGKAERSRRQGLSRLLLSGWSLAGVGRALAWCTAVLGAPLAAQVTGPSADDPADTPGPGSHLEVFLMTMGPGDAIWERFSHNALVVRDDQAGTELAYNWGIFSFSETDFIPRLLRGRMRYWMASYPSTATIEAYRRANRSVWLQRVNLTPEQRLELHALVRETDTEANRYYRYDYYRDNCSTRVRDALDRALGGQIRAATNGLEAGTSYRWHTARVLRPVLWAHAGIQFVMGNRADEPISVWDEMFLPLRLQRHLGEFLSITPEGKEVPLLGPAVQVVDAERGPVPDRAPDMLVWFLLAGIAIGGCFLLFGSMAGGSTARGATPWAGWLFVATGAGWSLIVGLAGMGLMLSWFLTDHYFLGLNENAFQANPVSLVVAPLLLLAATDRGRAWSRGSALAVAGLAVAGLALQVLPGVDQVNGEIVALAVPAHLGLAWGTHRAWPSTVG